MEKTSYEKRIVAENGKYLTMVRGKLSTNNRSCCGKTMTELKTKYPDCTIYALAGAKRRYKSMGHDIYFYAIPKLTGTINTKASRGFVTV